MLQIGTKRELTKIRREKRVSPEGTILPEDDPVTPAQRRTTQRMRAYSSNGVSVNSGSTTVDDSPNGSNPVVANPVPQNVTFPLLCNVLI